MGLLWVFVSAFVGLTLDAVVTGRARRYMVARRRLRQLQAAREAASDERSEAALRRRLRAEAQVKLPLHRQRLAAHQREALSAITRGAFETASYHSERVDELALVVARYDALLVDEHSLARETDSPWTDKELGYAQ